MRTITILCASLLLAVFWMAVLGTCGSGSDDDDEVVTDDDSAEDDDLDDDGQADDDASDDDVGDDDVDDDAPQIVHTEHTACKDGAGPAKEEWPQDLVFEYAGGVLTVTHVNAVFNCCLDDITVSFALGGFALNIYEDEVTPNPCFCECPFDVVTQIEGLEPGVYVVSAYTNGNFQIAETYVIP